MQYSSAGAGGSTQGAEDLSSKKNVRWHVEPHLSTMRLAVQRVIRGDDTTTKIANSYGIPARTLRRYVSHEKMSVGQQKLPDGRFAKSILNPDSDDDSGSPASGARGAGSGASSSAAGGGASTSTSRQIPGGTRPGTGGSGGRPPLGGGASSSAVRKAQTQPIAIRNPFSVARTLDVRRQEQRQRQEQQLLQQQQQRKAALLRQKQLQRQRQQQQQQQQQPQQHVAGIAVASHMAGGGAGGVGAARARATFAPPGVFAVDGEAEAFSDFMNPGSFGGVADPSPHTSSYGRFGGDAWDAGGGGGAPSSITGTSSAGASPESSPTSAGAAGAPAAIFGGPPVIGQGGVVQDPGLASGGGGSSRGGRKRSGAVSLASGAPAAAPAPASAPAAARVEKRNRGVSMDIFLEAFGSTPSPSTSVSSTSGQRLMVQAEAKRRNRADSRDLLRLAFTDDDAASAYMPPPESFSTQLLRAGLERARSKSRSDSFDFSAMQADFNEQFLLNPAPGESSRSLLSHGSLPRSRGNSVWSNDDADDALMSQIDLAI